MQNTILMVEVASASASASASPGEEEFNNNQIFKSETIILPPTKKKRNLPGMPDPDAEVIALSPKTLVATNRFVCEICKKGFQREQNLQLHRRGHNLPWKLKQRSNNKEEVVVRKRRVYVCPEASCINHDPSRALGDLTGIKKHFCRKHGEKKYKCERCSKKYAVRSDWKAHIKTCGTREYPCHSCGTFFSRRDSFLTHRAFCDALVLQEAASAQRTTSSHSPQPQPAAAAGEGGDFEAPLLSIQTSSSSAELPENQNAHLQPPPPLQPTQGPAALTTSIASTITVTTSSSSTTSGNIPCTGGGGVFAGTLNSSTSELSQSSQQLPASYSSGLLPAMSGSGQPAIDPMSLSLSSSFFGPSSLFPAPSQNPHPHYLPSTQPALSATALLQKAAQMGSTSSNSSFLRGLGLALPSSSGPGSQHNTSTMASTSASTMAHWNNNSVKIENNKLASGLGLGLSSSGSLGLNDLMMGPSAIFGSNKPATLDFLGLGMGEGESSPGGFSAFLNSIGGGVNMGNDSFGGTWDDSSDEKPSML